MANEPVVKLRKKEYSSAIDGQAGVITFDDESKGIYVGGERYGGEMNVQADWSQTVGTAQDYIKNRPTLATVATSGSYNDLSNKPAINNATLTVQKNGTTVGTFTANSSADKTVNITVPTVNDKILTIKRNGTTIGTFTANSASDKSIDISVPAAANTGVLTITRNNVSVGTFGANDSGDKSINITVPDAQVNADWSATSGVSQILNKPTLATVATSGSYNDLSNKPSINDSMLTITRNNVAVGTFTANSASAKTINISVPAAANTGLLTIQRNGTTVGTFSANDSSNKTVNITVPAAQVNSDWNSTSGVSQILNKPTLATVATSGSYNDLSNKPTIPAAANSGVLTIKRNNTTIGTFGANDSSDKSVNIEVPTVGTINTNNAESQSVNSAESLTGTVNLHKVSKTGSYNDLLNKPTIPTVNNATLTITRNTVTVGTFTANASSNKSIDITVPTTTNDLTNNSGFITSTVSDLSNYYKKTDTYTQTEVNNLLGALDEFRYEIYVSTSAVSDPQGNVLYLIGPIGTGNDKYKEYVYANNAWTMIGDTTIDLSGYAQTASLATVATSGSYNDLSNRPTIPTVNNATLTINRNNVTVGTFTANSSANKTVNIEVPAAANSGVLTITRNNVSVGTFSANESGNKSINIAVPAVGTLNTNNSNSQTVSSAESLTGTINLHKIAKTGKYTDILDRPALATVATSGSYNDLSNKPTIPTVNDATLTIQKNGSTIGTFTANSSAGKTVDMEVPEVLDDLEDVTISTATDGDFLLYIGTDEQWENVTPSVIEISESSGELYQDALRDYDGNSYAAAIIGSQVWMVENLKTTHYIDGTPIPESDTYDTDNYYRTYPGDTTDNVADYGRLYNGEAALHGNEVDGGKVAFYYPLLPEGWRLPTEADFDELLPNISEQESAPRSGSWNGTSNEVYAAKFNSQYAGMVRGSGRNAAQNSGGEQKASGGGRSNDFGFGMYMYLWSRTQADSGGGIDSKGSTTSGRLNVVTCQYYDPNDGGASKGGNDVVIADNAHVYTGTEDTGNFCSVRGVYDGTVDEFLAMYYMTHPRPSEGDPTPDGKFLKNLGDNQLAWSDISYNDLKERPFGDICFESRVPVETELYNITGHDSTNPSGGVLMSYFYHDFDNDSNPPSKMVIGGTVEVELDTDNQFYGNIEYLTEIFQNGSSSSTDTGEGWGLYIDSDGDHYMVTLTSEFGSTPPTFELVYGNYCTVKKIDNKYLDLADVAFSGSYSDLSDTPNLDTYGANIVHVGDYYGAHTMTGHCDKLYAAISANSYLFVDFQQNYNSAIAANLRYFEVFNRNGDTVGPNAQLWINGAAASSTNYQIPAGMYIVYYDGTKYMLRTDGKLTINGNVVDGEETNLASLSDVAIGTLADGQILQYDNAAGKWVNTENSGGARIIMRSWSNAN